MWYSYHHRCPFEDTWEAGRSRWQHRQNNGEHDLQEELRLHHCAADTAKFCHNYVHVGRTLRGGAACAATG